jgi:hexokinase
MAFAAGKVVVGPDVGNVGQILRETGNFTFAPISTEETVEAFQKALKASSKGKENKEFAIVHWSSDIVATKLLHCYENCKESKTLVGQA